MDDDVSQNQQEYNDICSSLESAELELNILLEKINQLTERKLELEETLTGTKNNDIISVENKKELITDPQIWSHNFPWNQRMLTTLNTTFHINQFRPLQKEILNVTLSQRDSILVMPTGGGKSLCFQLAAIVSDGFSLVISPLVSLMEDQLFSLKKLNIPSFMLNSSSTKEEINSVMNEMVNKSCTIKLVYVTPEKLAKSKRFMTKLQTAYEVGNLTRIVIDEVHCASQWGHDFRPDYKFLGIMKRQFPAAPILGLTATATTAVLNDLKEMLNLNDPIILKSSFNRSNIYYEVKSNFSSLDEILKDICFTIEKEFPKKSGIVYCFSRKDCENVATYLCKNGIKSMAYHAYLEPGYRSNVHQRWMNGKIQVVVATIAFGMGINKPDVEFVIHHSISKSLENFYQESGRAGRNGKLAKSILYFKFQDAFRQSVMVFTERTGLDKLHGMLKYALEKKQCRRSIIGLNFGEEYDSSLCNEMCDNCKSCKWDNASVGAEYDLHQHALQIKKVLEIAHAKQDRLTALKLIDCWKSQFKTELKAIKTLKGSSLKKYDLGFIIIHLILKKVLEEDFHFTPYNTISYVVMGKRFHSFVSAKKDLVNNGKEIDHPKLSGSSSECVDPQNVNNSGIEKKEKRKGSSMTNNDASKMKKSKRKNDSIVIID